MGGGGEISSSEVSLEVRKEKYDETRKSMNTVVLVGDRNSCYMGLGIRSRSGCVSVHLCVFNTKGWGGGGH